MGTARKGLVDKKSANSIREATMYSLIKVRTPLFRPWESLRGLGGIEEMEGRRKALILCRRFKSLGPSTFPCLSPRFLPPFPPPTPPLGPVSAWIQVNKGARASDVTQAVEGVRELRSNLQAFMSLEWEKPQQE